MSNFNIPIILKTLAAFWLLPLLFNLLFVNLDSESPKPVKVDDYELKVVDSQRTGPLDNAPILSLFEKIEPDRSKSVDEAKPVENKPKVIDKSLLPNFKRFDDKNQAGLAGIFSDGTPFAVIELKNYETKLSRFERVSVGQQIGAYTLVSIHEDSVDFKNNNELLSLQLFKSGEK